MPSSVSLYPLTIESLHARSCFAPLHSENWHMVQVVLATCVSARRLWSALRRKKSARWKWLREESRMRSFDTQCSEISWWPLAGDCRPIYIPREAAAAARWAPATKCFPSLVTWLLFMLYFYVNYNSPISKLYDVSAFLDTLLLLYAKAI